MSEPSTAPAQDADRVADDVILPRLGYTVEGPIAGEPATDVLIVTACGVSLRERMIEVATSADLALSPTASPIARTLVISNALLTDDGQVARDDDGRPRLSSRHEVSLTAEAMGRLGSIEALEQQVRDAREVAAALAVAEFRGMTLFDQVIAGRVRPLTQPSFEGE